MGLSLYNYKRNSKGKLEKTGTKSSVGRVSRGSAGGSRIGDTTGLAPTGQQIGGQPVYGNAQPQPVVPNASGAGLSYTPAPAPTAGVQASFAPDTSTLSGPVYGGSLQQAPPSPGPSLPNQESGSSSAPAPSVTSSSSAGAGGASNLPPAPQSRESSSQQPAAQASFNPPQTFADSVFASVKAHFQEEVFATTGISVDGYQPPEGTIFTAATVLPSPAALEQIVARQTALAAVERGSVKSLANLEKTGKMLLSPGGAETMASSIPEATGGKLPAVVPGVPAPNPRTFLETLKQINKVSVQVTRPLMVAGAVFSLLYGTISKSNTSETAIDNEITQFNAAFVKDSQTLRDAGYYEEANAIAQCAQDVKDALDSGMYDSLFNGKNKGIAALNKCKNELSAGLTQVAKDEAAQYKADQLKIQAEIEAEAQADATNKLQQQDFQRQQQEDQQSFQTSEREARQNFELQQQQIAAQQRAFDEATATQTSEGSTLTFGLLGTGGATEFVSKDRAAQVYFGKVYEELTPEQKALLNLLKGKGGN